MSTDTLARLVPSGIDAAANVGAVLNEAGKRVLAMLDGAGPSYSVQELDELRRRWCGFVAAASARRLAGTAIAHAVERRIELEIGRRLLTLKVSEVPELPLSEVTTCRLFARYEHVVLDVIERGTNGHPATRNRCMVAIRQYRDAVGDVPKTGRKLRRARKVAASRRPVMADGQAMARLVGGNTSVLYGLIRRAQAACVEINDPASRAALDRVYSALVNAEADCVLLLQAERCRDEEEHRAS